MKTAFVSVIALFAAFLQGVSPVRGQQAVLKNDQAQQISPSTAPDASAGTDRLAEAYPTVTAAPVNLAPNSQWEMMSGWTFSRQENWQGTGTVDPIKASANSVGSIGRAIFTVATTADLSLGDLVQVSGAGVDPCFTISPMRIVALTENKVITVRTPFGCRPAISHAATIEPITAGGMSAKTTGSGPDGWTKTATMPMWRNENRGRYGANMPRDVGAYASLGMTKDRSSPEHFYITIPTQNLAKYQGKNIVFGIYGFQKVKGGSGTWGIYTNDSVNGERTRCTNAAATRGYQWRECSFLVPMGTKYLHVGVQIDGAAADTYYFVNPVLAVGTVIGGVRNYQKPQGEILIPEVHISPIGWINASITFPSAKASFCESIGYCFEHDFYAETGGAIAPTVIKCHGQMEGIDAGDVATGSGYVRVMAFYDRLKAPQRSGSFLAQYVKNVKSFGYMDFAINQTDASADLLGTGVYLTTVASDKWTNVSEEIDWCVLN